MTDVQGGRPERPLWRCGGNMRKTLIDVCLMLACWAMLVAAVALLIAVLIGGTALWTG